MRFYKFGTNHYPYNAIISAPDAKSAVSEYVKIVADLEGSEVEPTELNIVEVLDLLKKSDFNIARFDQVLSLDAESLAIFLVLLDTLLAGTARCVAIDSSF